jgi:phosphohistidine swiveling domain-containing protein
MKLGKLLKIIKKHHWWEESGPGNFQFIMYPLNCFVEQSRNFHPKYCSVGIFVEKNDFFYEFSSEQEKYEIYKFIYNKVKNDRQYLVKKKWMGDKYKEFIKIGQNFEKRGSKLSNPEFWKSYREFMMVQYINYTRYVVMPECVDVFTAYRLKPLVRAELKGKSDSIIQEVTQTMATPAHLSFMEHERVLFLELCLSMYQALKNKKKLHFKDITNKSWFRKLDKLSRDYFWLRNTYANAKFITPADYFKEIKQEIRNKTRRVLKQELASLKIKVKRLQNQQEKILKQYKFSTDLKLHFYTVQFMGEWIDDRKHHIMQANHYINNYCEELARRFKINIWQVKYYLPEDFKNLLLKGKTLSPKIAKARRKMSAYVIEKKGFNAVTTIFYGKQASKILKALRDVYKYDIQQFTGQVASAPVKKIVGTVQVVMDTHKEKFKTGNILVTTMTRPEFVPYLRRAKAVITDEGGLTCHAAIVSRELKKPCIIGTKVATKVLKTGGRVIIDLEGGVVRKL